MRNPRVAATIGITLSLAPLLVGCGPAGLGLGISELARDGRRETLVLLVFVNESGEPVVLRADGLGAGGTPFRVDSSRVEAGARAELRVPASERVRVRAAQTGLTTAPPTWDFTITDPTQATRTVLDLQAGVVAALRANANDPERIVFDRLVGAASAPSFVRDAESVLSVTPDRLVVHPSGGYVYVLNDVGTTTVRVTAMRVDARSGAVQQIEAENGSSVVNPRDLARVGAFAEVDFRIDPSGRAAWLLDREIGAARTRVTILPLRDDGTFDVPVVTVRGRIGDLAFRPDGRRVHVTEDLGDGSGFVLREFTVDSAGRLGNLVTENPMPCVTTQPGRIVVHPRGLAVYVAFRDPISDRVKVGAYFTGGDGGAFRVAAECGDFRTLDDLVVEPSGTTLYVTGETNASERRVLRYDLDPVSGALGAFAEQSLGAVARLTSTDDPSRAGDDPLRRIVYVGVDDTLVPHVRGAGGALAPLAGAPTLGFGSDASARLVQGARRGRAVVSAQ